MKLQKSEYISSGQLCQLLKGQLIGNSDILIEGIEGIEFAKESELTFYGNPKYKKYFDSSDSDCIITYPQENLPNDNSKAYIIVENPYLEFVKFLIFLDNSRKLSRRIPQDNQMISSSAKISKSSIIYAGTFIGENVEIGDDSIIYPNSVIMDNSVIGKDSIIHSNATIYSDCIIGDNCIIHSGAVIGSDGFGYLEDDKSQYHKIPQLGNVIIENNCEIGANTTIDRATVGSTIIKSGVKIDNLVHVAHNCIIGENTGIAAQTGISGSVKIGKRNRFGGQVGIAGHIELGDDIILLAQSGIAKSIEKKGTYFGSPAKDQRTAFRIEAALRKLPEIIKELNHLKSK